MELYRPIIEDSITLKNADGTVSKELHYKIDINKSYKAITNKRAMLAAQLSGLQDGNTEAYERAGRIFSEMVVEIFGKDTVKELYEWYGEENATDMVWLLTPLIVEKIFPTIEKQREQVVDFRKRLSKYAEQKAADDV